MIYKRKRFELTVLYSSHAGYSWRNVGDFDTMDQLEKELFNIPHIIQDFNIYDSEKVEKLYS